jgi:hypothetical protein
MLVRPGRSIGLATLLGAFGVSCGRAQGPNATGPSVESNDAATVFDAPSSDVTAALDVASSQDGAAGPVDGTSAQDGVAGPDGTVEASASCDGGQSTSDLPGVHVTITSGPCALTQSQALAGVQFGFRLSVDADVPGVVAFDSVRGNCLVPDASGLVVVSSIDGGGQSYCPTCDMGRCSLNSSVTVAKAGMYDRQLVWHGRNWQGPSDTNAPEGSAFPPGQYVLSIAAKGTWSVDGSSIPFTVSVTRSITLLAG